MIDIPRIKFSGPTQSSGEKTTFQGNLKNYQSGAACHCSEIKTRLQSDAFLF